MQFPILSVIVFTPMIAGLLILLIPADRKTETRVAALAAGAIALALSIWLYFSYDISAAGYQFVEKYDWLPQLGISYYVGVDGMNAPLVLLTGVVMFTGVLISWGIDDRPARVFCLPVHPGNRRVWRFRCAGSVHAVLLLRDRRLPDVLADRHLGLEGDPRIRGDEADALPFHRFGDCPGRGAGDVLHLRLADLRYDCP